MTSFVAQFRTWPKDAQAAYLELLGMVAEDVPATQSAPVEIPHATQSAPVEAVTELADIPRKRKAKVAADGRKRKAVEAPNANQPWKDEDRLELYEHFQKYRHKSRWGQLSKRFGRSVASIKSQYGKEFVTQYATTS